ncbi:MAG: hypothetical protein OJF50_005384 [Nitrospira sp.]|nr:hypothetical protein [Nitrospira sp.]
MHESILYQLNRLIPVFREKKRVARHSRRWVGCRSSHGITQE